MIRPVRSLDDVSFLEARVLDRLVHGDIVPRRAFAHEPRGWASPDLGGRERAPHGHGNGIPVRHSARRANSGPGFPQRHQHLLGAVADGRNNSHTGDYHSLHDLPLSCLLIRGATRPSQAPVHPSSVWNKPTRRSFAGIDGVAIGFQPPIADTKEQLGSEDPLRSTPYSTSFTFARTWPVNLPRQPTARGHGRGRRPSRERTRETARAHRGQGGRASPDRP